MSRRWIFILCFSCACTTQKKSPAAAQKDDAACQRSWQYKTMSDTLSGTIKFFEQPIVHCGILSTASVALVKTESGKIVRVLSLCDIKKDFQTPNRFAIGDSVVIGSAEMPEFRVDLIPVDPEACTLGEHFSGEYQTCDRDCKNALYFRLIRKHNCPGGESFSIYQFKNNLLRYIFKQRQTASHYNRVHTNLVFIYQIKFR